MSSAMMDVPEAQGEPYFEFESISYEQYVAINDAVADRRSPRMIYADERLILLTPSHIHDWYAEIVSDLIKLTANELGIRWSAAGQTTYRRPASKVGVEGDRAFYLGPNAKLMSGPREIDLRTQPPPDLVVEVEHTHAADHAFRAWAEIGAREAWRYNVRKRAISFWRRRDNISFEKIHASTVLPPLRPADVSEQLRLAESMGEDSTWYTQLPAWVRETLLPRLADPS